VVVVPTEHIHQLISTHCE